VRPAVLVNRALVTHLPHPKRGAAEWKEGANVARLERRRVPVRPSRGLDSHPHADVRVTEYGPARPPPSPPAP
jgi:hypothetical protein